MGPTEGQADLGSDQASVSRPGGSPLLEGIAFKAGSAPSGTLPGSSGESFLLSWDRSHTLCTCPRGTYQAFGGGTSLAVP